MDCLEAQILTDLKASLARYNAVSSRYILITRRQ
jgi:hypothetical protein